MTISKYRIIGNLSAQEQLDLGAFMGAQLEDQAWSVYDSKGQCVEEDCPRSRETVQLHRTGAKFCYCCGNKLRERLDQKAEVDKMLYEMFIRTLEQFSR
jgi:hypothetical protein